WEYIKAGLVDPLHQVDAATAATMQYPTVCAKASSKNCTVKFYDPAHPTVNKDMTASTGLVVQHAISEMHQSPVFSKMSDNDIIHGGSAVHPTVAQDASDTAHN